MSRLQTIPGVGRDDTATPEGLGEFLSHAPFSRIIASRIVELGPLSLKFVFKVSGSLCGTGLLMEWDWQYEDPFGEETIEGVPPYWELIYNGAKEVADATWDDRDFPERLDCAIQNSTRDELYRVGLCDALNDATHSLRSAMRYRHYAVSRGGDLYCQWRVLRKRVREHINAIRILRDRLGHVAKPTPRYDALMRGLRRIGASCFDPTSADYVPEPYEEGSELEDGTNRPAIEL